MLLALVEPYSSCDTIHAETKALLSGIILCQENGWSNIMIETDSRKSFELISGKDMGR